MDSKNREVDSKCVKVDSISLKVDSKIRKVDSIFIKVDSKCLLRCGCNPKNASSPGLIIG